MDFFIKACQLLLALSILVILHEFGHYIPAKIFKTRVEKFYLFFNPWFSLFKKKVGETEWGIGWLPLGGYVKIAGMVDESMDKEQLAQPAQPWEFRSKKTWQRLIIMLGGVTVNLVVGILIYIFVVYGYGEDKLHSKDLKMGLAVHPYLKKYGIESGDNVLKVNGIAVDDIFELDHIVLLRDGRKLEVQKADGSIKKITLPENIDYELFQEGALPAFGPRALGTIIDTVAAKSPASKLDLKRDDKIISINNAQIVYYDQFQKEVYHAKGKKIPFKILRGKDTLEKSISIPKKGEYAGKFGFQTGDLSLMDKKMVKHFDYSFGKSISHGIDHGMTTLSDYAAQLKFLFTEKGATSIGGFGSIGSMFPSTWDWEIFWLRTAFISIVLAFMNILPIPALDGGHVVFLIYEMITGREAPQKVLEYAQIAGFVLLMGLLIYANGNDIIKYFF